MQSRIPAQDALEAFLPTGQEPDAAMDTLVRSASSSRWYPVDGGYLLRVLYDGGGYDAARYSLVPGGWDHEHCDHCGDTIEPMTLCWVTEHDPYVLLDEKCYRLVVAQGAGE